MIRYKLYLLYSNEKSIVFTVSWQVRHRIVLFCIKYDFFSRFVFRISREFACDSISKQRTAKTQYNVLNNKIVFSKFVLKMSTLLDRQSHRHYTLLIYILYILNNINIQADTSFLAPKNIFKNVRFYIILKWFIY